VKFVSVSLTPSANIRFTRRELNLMMECSRRHYDALCKSISAPGRDSFLYGWKQAHNLASKRRERSERVTVRQLDTLMKVVEVARYLRKEKDQQDAFGIGLKLRRVFARLEECVGEAPAGISL
jgi:hypothetical protein